jgi:hypothetical protein
MAQHYVGFHLWSYATATCKLLPQFQKVEKPHPGWAGAMTKESWQEIKAGADGVPRALAQAIGAWAFEQTRLTLQGQPQHWWRHGTVVDSCRLMCRSQCSGTCIVMDSKAGGGYGRLLIGWRWDKGAEEWREVRECVHRLVCWARSGTVAGSEAGSVMACHTGVHKGKTEQERGDGKRGDAGRRKCPGNCVQPTHLLWDTASANRLEQLARSQFKKYR